MTKGGLLSTSALLALLPTLVSAQSTGIEPLDMARVLAARYPQAASVSYVPALSWRASLRLSELTGEDRWADMARAEMQAFITGAQATIAPPYRLTSLAAYAAFSDLGDLEGGPSSALAEQAAQLLLQDSGDEVVPFATGWTDDMFMATSLLARVAARSDDPRYARVVGELLTTYAGRLQRPDGLFMHAASGPYAWGRGNGFAGLGLAEALTYLPETWSARAPVLDSYRRLMGALLPQQSDDGSWRQVIDEPDSYRELTITATALVAMARGIRLGWLSKDDFLPAVERAWRAVAARVGEDGAVRDVCTSTGAGPTLEYYLARPVVNGFDDRGGGLVFLAAIEMEELRRTL